jgi:hypothetical protein
VRESEVREEEGTGSPRKRVREALGFARDSCAIRAGVKSGGLAFA